LGELSRSNFLISKDLLPRLQSASGGKATKFTKERRRTANQSLGSGGASNKWGSKGGKKILLLETKTKG